VPVQIDRLAQPPLGAVAVAAVPQRLAGLLQELGALELVVGQLPGLLEVP
jgi:hypothetical protein